MTPGLRAVPKRWLPVLLVLAAAFLALPQGAFGLSGGMFKDTGIYPADFEEIGCASCHGGDDHSFAPNTEEQAVQVMVLDAEGLKLASGAYEPEGVYTVQIELLIDQQADGAGDSHAGFNLRATAGTLSAEGHEGVQVSEDGTQATHDNPGQTNWTVSWEAPASGAVLFDLFVNDVDGDGVPNAEDLVYRHIFALTDPDGAQLGAVAGEEHHVGVELPQYWLGLIALAGMLGIIVFSFVYIKFMSPHHTDKKDR